MQWFLFPSPDFLVPTPPNPFTVSINKSAIPQSLLPALISTFFVQLALAVRISPVPDM
jgi:hypothetical protein